MKEKSWLQSHLIRQRLFNNCVFDRLRAERLLEALVSRNESH